MTATKQAPSITALIALNKFLAFHREKMASNPRAIEEINKTAELAETKDDAYWAPLVEAHNGKAYPADAIEYAKALAAEIQKG